MPQRVMITGTSTGLGQALTTAYLAQQVEVWGCSRRPPNGTLTEGFHFQPIDLTDQATLPAQLERWLGDPCSCELAILNAGMLSPFEDMQRVSLETCRDVMELNLWSNKAILDWLLPRAPQLQQVVCISSGAGISGNRGWNAYAISKAALNMLTKLYAQECPQVHFSALAPGSVVTAMQDYLCNLPPDERFPTLALHRQRRDTGEMPQPTHLAPRLIAAIEQARTRLPSGEYFDFRQLPWEES